MRDAADLVVWHADREVIEPSQAWRAEPRGGGVACKPSTPRIPHTWPSDAGGAGGDVLGCPSRPHPTKAQRGSQTIITPRRAAVAPHTRQIAAVVRQHRRDRQERLRAALHPVMRGGSHSCSAVWSRETFEAGAAERRHPLRRGSRSRPPHTPRHGA